MKWVSTRRKSVEICYNLSIMADQRKQSMGSFNEKILMMNWYVNGDSIVPNPAQIIIAVLQEEMNPDDKTYNEICDLVEEFCVEFL